jgi:diguanylate cyclase (GGDEF)-like protein
VVLGELATPVAVTPADTSLADVESVLRSDELRPGVLTAVDGRVHLLDRAQLEFLFAGRLGYGRALLARQPLSGILADPALVLPAGMAWDVAARAVLDRPSGQKGHPVVVEFAGGDLGIAPVGPLIEHLSGRYAALALQDELTGLGNRRMLADVIDAADPERPAALLLLDLDRFKDINDELGHHGADEVLRYVGGTLARMCGAERAFRLAGDEFVLLLDWFPEDLEPFGRQLLDTIRAPVVVDGTLVTVEASMGIASGPAGGLLAKADAAMFAAKRDRTAVEVWRPEMADEHHTDLRLQAELWTAIEERRLVLHYQPLVDAADGTIRSVEALVRWEHPERGLLLPAAFLPQAERSAAITVLTDRVLADAVEQAARWQDEGRQLPVAVNLPAPVLAHDRIVEVIAGLLDKHGLPASALIVEVTESAVMTRPERSAERLRTIRDLGVRVAMDDFGTGFTSLALLTQLPLDELKLDRAFVHRVHDPRERVIVEAVARMARGLGLTLVAEGVEDQHTADTLRALGFDLLQGYHFGRPVPAEQLPVPAPTAKQAGRLA